MAENHIIHSHLLYVEGSSANGHALDLYEPKKEELKGRLSPLVIYIHGGGWTERDKKDFDHIGTACVTHGLSCAIINYRLSPLTVPEDSEDHFKHPGHVEDCAHALAYLYANASAHNYDSSNVIILGHSAGGFMAAHLQFESRIRQIWKPEGKGLAVRHYVGLQGIYDLSTILKDFGKDYLTYMVAPGFGWKSETHEKVSPTKMLLDLNSDDLVDSDYMTPWTLIWSDKDTMVNMRQSEDFERALGSVGVQVNHKILSPADAEAGSHHGVTQKVGFEKYILPILLDLVPNKV